MSLRVPATKSPQSTFQGLMGLEAVDWNGRRWDTQVGCLEGHGGLWRAGPDLAESLGSATSSQVPSLQKRAS